MFYNILPRFEINRKQIGSYMYSAHPWMFWYRKEHQSYNVWPLYHLWIAFIYFWVDLASRTIPSHSHRHFSNHLYSFPKPFQFDPPPYSSTSLLTVFSHQNFVLSKCLSLTGFCPKTAFCRQFWLLIASLALGNVPFLIVSSTFFSLNMSFSYLFFFFPDIILY